MVFGGVARGETAPHKYHAERVLQALCLCGRPIPHPAPPQAKTQGLGSPEENFEIQRREGETGGVHQGMEDDLGSCLHACVQQKGNAPSGRR